MERKICSRTVYGSYMFAAANDKKDIPVAAIATTVSIGSITVILCGYLFWKLLAKHRGN